jgi:hypothetical protein
MFAEFDKVVRCLALELPESVHADVVAKYGKLKAEVEKFISTNKQSIPCQHQFDLNSGSCIRCGKSHSEVYG